MQGTSWSDGYNYTYPHTPTRVENGETWYRVGIIADLDHSSKHSSGYWFSYFQRGDLVRTKEGKYRIEWEGDAAVVKSHYNEKGRGCELSDLQFWNGKAVY
jgi:hypothetical protein